MSSAGLKMTRGWLARVAGDRESYASAGIYEGAMLGVLAAMELVATRDPTSTLWHKMWRSECAQFRLPTLAGVALADEEKELAPLVLAALDPILHEAVPTGHSADAQLLADYLEHFRLPHADLPAEHVEGFCVEFVTVYQLLRAIEPEYLTAWRLWRTVIADANRPGKTLTETICGRIAQRSFVLETNGRIRRAMLGIGETLEPVWVS